MTPPRDLDVIDLRSDTVTRPTPGMREAMARAPLGDDVIGDDPTVIALQERVAALLGTEAALFVPSGTMANLLALKSQTEPGDEVILHRESHVYYYETAGFAAVAGLSLRFIDSPDGRFGPGSIDPLVRPGDDHFPRTRLVEIENTHNRAGGVAWSVEDVARVSERARALGLRVHMDGARLWNACIARGVSPERFARHADTVSVCFSKGLGCPVGSALCGSRSTIARAHRTRKMLGGGMRQSGVLAGAALYALDHHLARLAEDHANARLLGERLSGVPGVTVNLANVQTNMVYFNVSGDASALCRRLGAQGVLAFDTGPSTIRAVCHLDVSRAQIERAAAVIARECAAQAVG
ncbi:MAG: aminotransferase class I/II-fold pyridoxal phosphate-dependent enzyme [Phycisphaerales bacterium]|nr:aminotransferase class I/II-fold pyridoxal phosphate-dependent enzyme [Phycisphaerales bacterium]